MNVGDIVQLKSGGQVMTVERAEEGKEGGLCLDE